MNMRRWASAWVLGVLLVACSNGQSVTVVTVTPAEGGAGIQKALALLRETRAKAVLPLKQPLKVVLEPGQYLLHEPIKITAADSGTPGSPTVIEARQPGTAVLQGAVALPGQVVPATGMWSFTPPGPVDRAAERSGGQLFVNGRRAVLAQYPNEGQFHFVDKAMPSDSGAEPSKEAFKAALPDAQAMLALLDGQRDRAIVSVMQSWTHSDHRLSSLDAGTGALKVAPAAKWPFLFFGASQRYVIKNLPTALDAPGEWVLDGQALRYKPRPDDAQANVVAHWPRLQRLLLVAGDGVVSGLVEHVHINGLAFEYAGETTPMQGFVDTQAAVNVGAAIEVEGAKGLRITNCRVRHTGGHGIWLKRGVTGSEVSGCMLDDLGAGGIRVGEAATLKGPLATEGNVVRRNVITNTGRSFPGAVGIWVGRSSGNEVTDNLIAHTSYTGISVGWQWGFAEPTAINNKVRNNVLIDIGQGMLSDLGGIYTLGRSPGTEITGNFIRQVEDYPAYGAGAWGIYNDEGTTDMLVKGNVVVGTRSGGYHLHYGRDNEVIGNLFSAAREAEIRWSAVEKSGSWRLEGNGIDPTSGAEYDVRGNMSLIKQARNVRGSKGGGGLSVVAGAAPADISVSQAPAESLEAWRSVIAHARELSKGLASMPKRPERLAAKAAVTQWVVDLDSVPAGGRPVDLRSSPKTPAEAVSVIDEDSGTRCLRLTDGTPGMARYDPHVFLPLDVPATGLSVAFSAKIDANSLLVHEWRDGSRPFNTGPSISLAARGLAVGGKVVSPLPLGEWFDVEIKQAGSDKGGQWALRLRERSGEGPWRNLGAYGPKGPAVPGKWQWVGWFSDTEQASVACLKSISAALK